MKAGLIFSIIIIFFFLMYVTRLMVYAASITLNNQTKNECHEYAKRNHALEVSIPRYQREKKFIDGYDWYDDCLNNVNNPVPKS